MWVKTRKMRGKVTVMIPSCWMDGVDDDLLLLLLLLVPFPQLLQHDLSLSLTVVEMLVEWALRLPSIVPLL